MILPLIGFPIRGFYDGQVPAIIKNCRHRLSVQLFFLFPTERQTFCNPALSWQDRSALSSPLTAHDRRLHDSSLLLRNVHSPPAI